MIAQARAESVAAAAPAVRALIRADREVAFQHVIRAMDLLKQGGVTRTAFGVAPP